MIDVFLPEILETQIFYNKVILRCVMPSNLFYFRGHFPLFPVLPGVVQVHWAVCYANEFFKIDSSVNQIHSTKFMNVIIPESVVLITIEHSPDLKFFTYIYSDENDNKLYSSGRINLKN